VQDKISEISYTDVDYRVVTDGSHHVYNYRSPFDRHTYRYTPLIAYLLIPNILIHPSYGKFLFALFDLVIAVLIKLIIVDEYWLAISNEPNSIESNKAKLEKKFSNGNNGNKIKSTRNVNLNKKERWGFLSWINFGCSIPLGSMSTLQKYEKLGNYSAYAWLYNPLTMIIATRGNGDAITCSLVLISIYYLLKVETKSIEIESCHKKSEEQRKEDERNVIVAGFFHGLAIHFRLYPIFFSLAYYLYLSEKKNEISGLYSFVRTVLQPNRKQILLVLSVLKVLIFSTGIFFLLYKFEFLYESIFYHFLRKDTRHNFSLYFYLQYLNSEQHITILEKLLTFAPQLLIIVLISINFCKCRQTLLFALFLISFIMVTYNPVVTSQYFVWFLSLLPLSLNNLKNLSIKKIFLLSVMWFLGQGGWLMFAYFLEFKGYNTFDFIFFQSVIFFLINISIVHVLISNYDVYSIKLK
jgi:phosphatidylinositol glycan class M